LLNKKTIKRRKRNEKSRITFFGACDFRKLFS
jgi:hypothetical protein